MQPKDFSQEELAEILKQARSLLSHGYFTGINFIQSQNPLPIEAILVHFLHDSQTHVEHIKARLPPSSLVVPRFTFYLLDSKYFDKPGFDEEYQRALFFDENFRQISLKDAKIKREGITTANEEFDLLTPLDAPSLETVVRSLRETDAFGPEPWVDPVIIIRTQTMLPMLPGFVNPKPYVNIRKNREEIYTVLPDEGRAEALKRYLKRLCERAPLIGELDENSVAFDISQINEKFLSYMLSRIKPLKILE